MKTPNTVVKLICLLIVLCAAQIAVAQEVPQPPRPSMPEGAVWVNPKPGIAAPGDQQNGTRTVTSSRGFGDASLGYFLELVGAYATTWLNNNVTANHVICARVIELAVNGYSYGGNTSSQCKTTKNGGSVEDSRRWYAATCGHVVYTQTYHSIVRTGVFNWGEYDTDNFLFCS
jgi:hypothetical protein